VDADSGFDRQEWRYYGFHANPGQEDPHDATRRASEMLTRNFAAIRTVFPQFARGLEPGVPAPPDLADRQGLFVLSYMKRLQECALLRDRPTGMEGRAAHRVCAANWIYSQSFDFSTAATGAPLFSPAQRRMIGSIAGSRRVNESDEYLAPRCGLKGDQSASDEVQPVYCTLREAFAPYGTAGQGGRS
jgi:hypothetical protein